MLRLAFYLIAGYMIAAGFSSDISFDLSQTDWVNLWTYVSIALGMFISGGLLVIFWFLFAFSVIRKNSHTSHKKRR